MVHVTLISYTPHPERTIAAAARVSTSSISATELIEKLTPEAVDSLLTQLLTSGHLSPFEHASFTFAIEGISRVTSHQLVRHRMASYTQQSQRYVSLKEVNYITPATISAKTEWGGKYHDMVHAAHRLYREMLNAGIPAEDARYVLPQATETRLVMTMNARELIHVCELRLCLRAQWEIVELFEKVKAEVERVAPRLGVELKPKCYRLGYCDEAQSCGIFPTAKEVVGERR
ncbi:MAG: FAD-dependent thymidylate synthase [Dehalococcoidia bacterium]|nr:FAD-dependent thymidylate synthase [Dehalococcoidia bacterium]